MARMARKELPRYGIWQVVNRSAGLVLAFRDGEDRDAQVALMKKCSHRFGLRLHAWTVLGTHYHGVFEGARDDLSVAMRWLNGVYAQRFNVRWGRWGHLYGDRFSSWVIRDEEHFEATLRYVRDNPVAAALCHDPSDWQWTGPRRLFDLAEPPSEAQRALGPADPVCRACLAEALAVREVPVVGGTQRLGVGELWRPAESFASPLDRDERVGVRRPVVPFGERRQPRELEGPQHQLCRTRRHRPQPCLRAGVADQRLEVVAHRPEAGRTDVERQPSDVVRVERAHDRIDEILDGQQLVAIGAV